ncbi:MAG TPA: hypothetical protein VGY56_21720 [Verrucomicrobiae bacterium]|nr:hypothetical protein [Verrucomicrobiae bacterium]
MGLMNLHQWFWKIKFVEVDGHLEIDGGGVDPKVGTTFIHAEFDDFEEGRWLVPLVNLANTHLLDQLRQFYKDDPKAFPSPERITRIMDEELKKRANQKKATELEQIKRQRLIQKTEQNVRIFIDESGDVGFAAVHDVYVYAPVAVKNEMYASVVAELRGLLSKHWGENAPKEIHMSAVPASMREEIQNDFARIILKYDIRILCCAMSKWPFLKHLFRCHAEARFHEEMPLNIAWAELVADKEYFLQANFLAITVEEVVAGLAIDFLVNGISAEFYHDRKHRVWMNNALQLGFKKGIEAARKHAENFFGLPLVPPMKFAVADSEIEACLWLSDWLANELRAWFYHQPLSSAFEKAKQNIRFVGFDEHGVKHTSREIGGHSDEELPDLPREIRRGDPVGKSI